MRLAPSPTGQLYSGTCATLPADPLFPSKGSLSWCPTVREVGYYTPPVGQQGAGTPSTTAACPVTWDACTPPGGRAAVRSDTHATVTCEFPSPLPVDVTPSLTLFDCAVFDPAQPGAAVTPWCYANATGGSATKVQATCIARGCAPRLQAVCPPRTNDTEGVTACLQQVSVRHQRAPGPCFPKAYFDSSTCTLLTVGMKRRGLDAPVLSC